ncbi:MAG: carboxypeptidase regulatory-like domain-containing protein [Gammaproteobacteria bacterium]|nr:carboxypeptidase regulatory-like domain-containing protein [Gammaproteobacteria bacterium]
MNRLKLLATATLMALTFTACDEGTPPPVEPPPPPTPVGTISGTVTIEGTAASGITATLSSGATTTTGSGGSFAFSGVEAGTYTVTISGFPEDATFAQVTQSATIASDGQNVQLNFAGEYIRSSAVVGNVVAADAMMSGGDGQPETLVGVTVTLGGEHAMGETMETAEDGGFAFTGLRAGTYTVTISDFPEDVSFETVSVEVEVEVGEVGSADFTGHFIRTSAVEGQVVIEGEGLAGVTVTLSGGPADESYTAMTDADGMYRFEELRPGDYTVSISDFDTRDYEFAATSQDVSVDLDETGTVSFTGVLLRTSGISGRVSVEGMGLGDIAVTLSGAADASTTTDAGGQYAFAGLAAGDYTVSIAVDDPAYVFDSMSMDRTVGDDESAIVNFEGAHARTASVSGMVFLDEATKNNMYDEGEHPLAHAGIPVALVGPGVNEQRLGATDATGAFSFTELQAGPYQLVVLINATVAAALAANDVAYGGAGEGYAIALGVGEAAAQNIPFDITHTTVNFTVSLKHGDDMGAAVPGATVTLYSGDNKVGSGDTGDDGSVMIKVARAGTSGNMVMAGVAADGYDVADGMTEVSWDPQMFGTAAGNSNDIVNLNVDATVSGATITTDYGGGEALAGWAIGVMHGEDAVEGAPEMLDDDGNAALMTTVAKDDLPATFAFAVADDQDDRMDGGESYEGSAVEYTHTGLALAGTMDAGTIEVAYSTQTLKVYVHHERDQVMGYTGNLLGGDVRDEGMVSVGIRYVDDSGRSRAFTSADKVKSNSSGGVHTFTNVPADKNVIVQASKTDAASSIKLLEPDELAAYTGMDVNGITGGAFGAMGGFNHTVELCPLQATTPQDHGECASFAYVTTHTVSGLVWKMGVSKSGDDFEEKDPVFVPGQTVSLSPVEGKNLAGEEESFTTTEKDDRKDKTKGADPTHAFSFSGVASGAYELNVPDGWRAKMGDKGATADVGDALSPLDGPVSLDVTPATATVYGRVDGGDGFPLEGVTVDVNGRTAMTDASGRYIVDGVSAVRGKVFVSAAKEGQNATKPDSTGVEFGANTVSRFDIDLSAVGQTASISGTVRASGTAAPVAGAEVTVTGSKVTNLDKNGKLLTDAEGSYTAIVEAVELGGTVSVSVSKKGMSFAPASIGGLPAHANSAISGIDFTGFVHATITGVVVAPGGGPLSGVALSATSTTDTTLVVHDTTGVTGRFSLSVPYGGYTVAASLDNHVFGDPSASSTGWTVPTAPGQTVDIGRIQAMTAMARNVSAMRETDTTTVAGVSTYNGTVTVRWIDSADDVPVGYSDAVYSLETNTGTDGAWEAADGGALAGGDTTGLGRFTAGADDDGEFMVRVVATAQNDTDVDPQHTDPLVLNSGPFTLAAVDPSVSGVAAALDVTADTTVADTFTVTWDATTNDRSEFRITVQLAPASLNGQTFWFVAEGGAPAALTSSTREWELEIAGGTAPAGNVAWDVAVTGGAADVPITAAELRAATMVRVESRQGATGDWMSVAASVTGGS